MNRDLGSSIKIMPKTEVVDLSTNADNQSAVAKCVELLRASGVAVVPTETVYGVAARLADYDAIQKLMRAKNRDERRTLAVAVNNWKTASLYADCRSKFAEKLARLYWPGPLTLIMPSNERVEDLPTATRELVAPVGFIGLRAPRNEFLIDVLNQLGEPIVLTSANLSGEPPTTNAQGALRALNGRVDLIVNGGATPIGVPSTVARIMGYEVEILREGEITRDALREAARKTILFICDANTCRSVIAEALCKKIVAERVGDARAREYKIISAGVDAFTGDAPTQVACETLESNYNISIAGSRSRRIHYRLLDEADLIYCMDESQRQATLKLDPNCESRIRILDPSGREIKLSSANKSSEVLLCALRVEEALTQRMTEILER